MRIWGIKCAVEWRECESWTVLGTTEWTSDMGDMYSVEKRGRCFLNDLSETNRRRYFAGQSEK